MALRAAGLLSGSALGPRTEPKAVAETVNAASLGVEDINYWVPWHAGDKRTHLLYSLIITTIEDTK